MALQADIAAHRISAAPHFLLGFHYSHLAKPPRVSFLPCPKISRTQTPIPSRGNLPASRDPKARDYPVTAQIHFWARCRARGALQVLHVHALRLLHEFDQHLRRHQRPRGASEAFRVWGLEFRVWSLEFGVCGLEFGVWGLEFRV